ncbi:MAG: ImmA/IrrE family metallo-endopeptidase [Tepidisphaeraceae bacterium]
MLKVAVEPSVLEWAIDRSTRGRAALEQRFPKLSQWLSGDESPTINQLEAFAKAASTPLGFLFLKSPPVERLSIPHYRTLDNRSVSTPSPELIDTLFAMQRRQAWLRDYLIEDGRDRVPLVNCATTSEPASVVTERIRRTLGLTMDWASEHATWTDALRRLRDAVGDAGVVVVVNGVVGNNTHRPLDVEEFRGFVLVDEYAPLVFVNGADSKSAQMFTLAHELAHLVFGSSAAFDLRQLQPSTDAIEQACNAVAAEFLVPAELLRRMTFPNASESFGAIARAFKVSPIVAGRRMLDLQMISRDEFFAFYRTYMEQERHKKDLASSGGDFNNVSPLRVGTRFAVELVRALRQGRVLYNEAYRLAGISGNAFSELARRTAGVDA